MVMYMPVRIAALLVVSYIFLELTAYYALGMGSGFFSIVRTLQALASMD